MISKKKLNKRSDEHEENGRREESNQQMGQEALIKTKASEVSEFRGETGWFFLVPNLNWGLGIKPQRL